MLWPNTLRRKSKSCTCQIRALSFISMLDTCVCMPQCARLGSGTFLIQEAGCSTCTQRSSNRSQNENNLILVCLRFAICSQICLFDCLAPGASSVTLHWSSGWWLMLASSRLARGFSHHRTHWITSTTLEQHASRFRMAIEGCGFYAEATADHLKGGDKHWAAFAC